MLAAAAATSGATRSRPTASGSAADAGADVVELDRPVVVDRYRGRVDDVDGRADARRAPRVVTLAIDGAACRRSSTCSRTSSRSCLPGPAVRLRRGRTSSRDHAVAAGDGALTAPMPGTVLDVGVAEGDQVEEGQVLGVLEAMKMELSLKAPFAGTVTGLSAAPGAQVALGTVLFQVQGTEQLSAQV